MATSLLFFGAVLISVLFDGARGSSLLAEKESTSIANSTISIQENKLIYGWVDQPNFRGTMSIVYSCLFTIFICTYTMLCLNVPAMNDTSWTILRRRLFWMAIAIAGPEFVLGYASGQWGTARESVKAFAAAGYSDWTLRHGFFADMGGFHLEAPDMPAFPATAKQLHWLITHNYLPFPEVSTAEMNDKSKQDAIGKFLTCFQIGYLVLQCLGRAGQHLTVTTMELSALAIVVCSIATSYCWWHKPADVRTPIRLQLKVPISNIRCSVGGLAAQPYQHTPLDFVDNLLPSWSLNVQPLMNTSVALEEGPIHRLGNDRIPNLKGYQEACLCVATFTYASIHLVGWNFYFPTQIERIMWRVCSMFLFGNTVAFWIFETCAAWYRIGRWQRLLCRLLGKEHLGNMSEARRSRETTTLPGNFPLPAEVWSIFPLACTYAVARLYLLVETFVGLREMDATAYLTVNWAAYLPHV